MSDRITGHTVLLGLLGQPVAHSISPMMHNEAFRQLGLDYAYLAFDVGTENLKTAVDGLKTLGVRGFNLTMPNKRKMCDLCDTLSPAAELIGAVNTVVCENGRLIGHNTDGIGYMAAAADAGFLLQGKVMTLLGAGGAATAICVQAALDGVKAIHVFNRKSPTYGQMAQIIEKLKTYSHCDVQLHDLADKKTLCDCISESDILVNGTSVGMAPNVDGCLIDDSWILHESLVVSDVIYNPRETKLMEMARERGCKTFNGMYMLLYQGAAAFKLWTGQEMPIDCIKAKYFGG